MLKKISISALFLAILSACSSEKPIEPTKTPNQASMQGFSLPHTRSTESSAKILSDYAQYNGALEAAKSGNDVVVAQFLSEQSQSAMGEAVRNEWLKNLGKRGDVATFSREYRALEPAGRQQEVRCYAEIFGLEDNQLSEELVRETNRLPLGCTTLIEQRASQSRLNSSLAWRRVRGLIASNQITDASRLATALGSPLDDTEGQGAQENLLRDIISPNAQKNLSSAARLMEIEPMLTREQAGFAWGVLGHQQAKNRQFSNALDFYSRSDITQLNREQIEWYARSALRQYRWQQLASVIEAMPHEVQKDPTWQYWLARSYTALGKHEQAQTHYQQAQQSGRNFYALLATEELGSHINTQNNVADASAQEISALERDGAIHHALTLFQASQSNGDWAMRRLAQAQWRYAIRHFNEHTKLAAAQLALNRQFYEMAINTAETTDKQLNYRLRYISPFREIIEPYATQVGIDPAWVYGLIRQESRFMLGVKSRVGATGLMQVMPATAREIAAKIGMNSAELYTLEGNIRMGTWYLSNAKNNLQNNEVMATAGYNAGPGRARQWQDSSAMEGAIYAETIPFDETRDYVKKVMTNATYYASLFNEKQTSLKQRMGVIPARY